MALQSHLEVQGVIALQSMRRGYKALRLLFLLVCALLAGSICSIGAYNLPGEAIPALVGALAILLVLACECEYVLVRWLESQERAHSHEHMHRGVTCLGAVGLLNLFWLGIFALGELDVALVIVSGCLLGGALVSLVFYSKQQISNVGLLGVGGISQRKGHANEYGGESQGDAENAHFRKAFCWTGSILFVQVSGGLWSGSLALLFDSFHVMTDVAALALAWYAKREATKPVDETFSQGRLRIKVVAPLLSSLLLVGFSVIALLQVPGRFHGGHDIETWSMSLSACYAIVVNCYIYRLLKGKSSLNERAAALHVLGDIAISLAVVAGSLVIAFTGWQSIDPLLSVIVGAFVLRGAWQNARECLDILLERTPRDVALAALDQEIKGIIAGKKIELERLAVSCQDDETLVVKALFLDHGWNRSTERALRLRLNDILSRACPAYRLQLHYGVRSCAETECFT